MGEVPPAKDEVVPGQVDARFVPGTFEEGTSGSIIEEVPNVTTQESRELDEEDKNIVTKLTGNAPRVPRGVVDTNCKSGHSKRSIRMQFTALSLAMNVLSWISNQWNQAIRLFQRMALYLKEEVVPKDMDQSPITGTLEEGMRDPWIKNVPNITIQESKELIEKDKSVTIELIEKTSETSRMVLDTSPESRELRQSCRLQISAVLLAMRLLSWILNQWKQTIRMFDRSATYSGGVTHILTTVGLVQGGRELNGFLDIIQVEQVQDLLVIPKEDWHIRYASRPV